MIRYEFKKILKMRGIRLIFLSLIVLNGAGSLSDRAKIEETVFREEENRRNYHAYLEEILAENEHQSVLSALAGADSYAGRDLAAGRAAYERLYEVPLPAYTLTEIAFFADSERVRVLTVVFMFLVAAACVMTETESGMDRIIFSTMGGIQKGYPAKAAALVSAGFFVSVLFRVENLAVGVFFCGTHPLNVPVQAVPGYLASPLKITAGRFMGLVLIYDFIQVSLLAAGALFIMLLVRNWTAGLLTLSILSFIAWAIAAGIGGWTPWAVLKYASPAAALYFMESLASWRTFRFWGRPVPVFLFLPAVHAALAVLFFAAGRRVWKMRTPKNLRSTARLYALGREEAKKPIKAHTLWQLETKKLFVHARAGLVLLALLAVQTFSYGGKEYHETGQEYWYRMRSRELVGELTEEKGEIIKKWEAMLQDKPPGYEEIMERRQNGEISLSYMQYLLEKEEKEGEERAAIERIVRQYEGLLARKERGKSAEYIVTTPYDIWLGRRAENLFDDAKMLLAVLIGIMGLARYEKSSGMEAILLTRKDGFERIKRERRRVKILYAALCFGAACLPRIVWILAHFDLEGLWAPAGSLSFFRMVLSGIPILAVITGIMAVRLLACILISLI
ncbi:MAG: hypothetical protein VZQ82_00905 [Lachnospiraceae bacterium]|nr:hypothetical protein [Lachnospiraceae bacterium]